MSFSSSPRAVPVEGNGRRVVSCDLTFEVAEPAEVVLQVKVASSSGAVRDERLAVRSDDEPVADVTEHAGPDGARVQVIQCGPGRLSVAYRAEVDTTDHPAAGAHRADSSDLVRLTYLRPSRYCPSDHLVGFAVSEFGTGSPTRDRVASVNHWISTRVGYVAGSSTVHDSAEDTLLTGMGTCRDFAHLGVALCRAVGVPARFTAVYAPGLSPMDFHAVFETLEDGQWWVQDATMLAPRQAMVRIATGRDATDAAFASVTRGVATLETVGITATVTGDLPVDHRALLVRLP
jgi:transglutaminase-like putative cysteine protease